MCIYVRELLDWEGNQLKRYLRRGKDPVTINRAHVVLASAQGMRVPEISRRYHYSDRWVREIIHLFNERGIEAIFPHYAGGSSPTFTEEQKAKIVEVALSRPKDLGLPFTQWSLSKLQEYVIEQGIVESISHEWVRRILRNAGITYQRTKTWKQSNDPEYELKKRVLELYRNPPSNGKVMCFDEFGPLEVKPIAGANWRAKGRPDRLPATYVRTQGVQHLLAVYDLEEDKLYAHMKPRK